MELPPYVEIIEVGPRDGFQNIIEFIPTRVKMDIINTIIASGIREIELTSFVNPKAVPQMADAAEIAETILSSAKKPARPIALVPNFRGVQNAYKSGIRVLSFVISATEGHNKANVNRSKKESVEDLKNIISEFPDIEIRLDIATAFGCPYEGYTPEDDVVDLLKVGVDSGVREIVLCDTIGIANPKQVFSLCQKTLAVSTVPITLHLHDTRGMGLANMLAGMQSGVSRFETSIGGLGGCPFAPGAAGNTSSEDAINMLKSMHVDTGIDLIKYLEAVNIIKQRVKSDLTSCMAVANILAKSL